MKRILQTLPLVIGVFSATDAKPLPDATVDQAAARIDYLIGEDLKRAKLKPSPLIDDATFVRRSYLGIAGRIPSEEEARAFLDDRSASKHADKIALIRSLSTTQGAHEQGKYFMHTGYAPRGSITHPSSRCRIHGAAVRPAAHR